MTLAHWRSLVERAFRAGFQDGFDEAEAPDAHALEIAEEEAWAGFAGKHFLATSAYQERMASIEVRDWIWWADHRGGLTYREIAKKYGVSYGQVYQRVKKRQRFVRHPINRARFFDPE